MPVALARIRQTSRMTRAAHLRLVQRLEQVARADAGRPDLHRLRIEQPQVGKGLELGKGAGIAADLQLVALQLARKVHGAVDTPPATTKASRWPTPGTWIISSSLKQGRWTISPSRSTVMPP